MSVELHPLRNSQILTLRERFNLSYGEIARRLKVTRGIVAGVLDRERKRLERG